jgi:hypothetical protein
MYDARTAARVGDPVLDVYAAIDAAIGQIAAAAGSDADVIVLSATGMCSNYSGNHLLDAVLRRLEGVEPPRSARLGHALEAGRQAAPSRAGAASAGAGRSTASRRRPRAPIASAAAISPFRTTISRGRCA